MTTTLKELEYRLNAHNSTINKFNQYYPCFVRISKREIRLTQSLNEIKKNYEKYKEIVKNTPRRYKSDNNFKKEVKKRLDLYFTKKI